MSWAVLRFMAKNSPRNPASASLPDTDANVLFYLNLPPKTVVNHKAKWVITLAYGQKPAKRTELFTAKMRIIPHKRKGNKRGFSRE
ncbi:hypothetical protein DVA43_22715 [Leclercia sp. W6]|nr:hypothetical protein DVA43_22715 [Leclercia sp. W6]